MNDITQAKLYVSDMKKYLAKTRMSPEQFAKEVRLSSMTIRRWLKKDGQVPLPPKYLSVFGPRFGCAPQAILPKFSLARALTNLSMDSLMNEIESKGRSFIDGIKSKESADELNSLDLAIEEKLEKIPVDQVFTSCCRQLSKFARSSRISIRSRAVAAGALLYFADPISVPDDTPLIGYLGELSVLSVALNTVYSLSGDGDRA